jgi:hypothetical protein
MTLLPIIERELLVRARRRATYRMRLGAALAGALICLPQCVFTGPFMTPGTVGQHIFNSIVGAAFVLSCAACLLTADAVSSERREGTLGLLFLTRVKGLDVLLGKLGSAGLGALCALAALLPLLMIPVLLGGVTGGEACRKGLALLDALCFALAVGLYESASHREQFRAALGAAIMVALVVIVPALPLAGPGSHPFWQSFSPLTALNLAGDLAYRAAPVAYWVSLGTVQALAWLLLAGASFRLRRSVREAGGGELPSAAPISQSRLRRPQPIAANQDPVEWLVRRQRGLRAAIWAAALVTAANRLTMMVFYWFPFGFRGPLLFGLRTFGPLPWLALDLLCGALFAWAASRFFVEARRTGELELLLTTPLGAEQVVAGQWRALKGLLLAPLLLIVLAVATPALLPVLLQYPAYYYRLDPTWPFYLVGTSVLSMAYEVVALAALCWLGLWFGLKSPGQASALLRAVALGQVVPYLANYGGLFGVFSLRSVLFGPGGPLPLAYSLVPWLPQFLVLLYFISLIRWARRRLRQELSRAGPARFTLRRGPAPGSAGFQPAASGSPCAGRSSVP